jgi:hypothetical protein
VVPVDSRMRVPSGAVPSMCSIAAPRLVMVDAGHEEWALPVMPGVEVKALWFSAQVSCSLWSILAGKFPQNL